MPDCGSSAGTILFDGRIGVIPVPFFRGFPSYATDTRSYELDALRAHRSSPRRRAATMSGGSGESSLRVWVYRDPLVWMQVR